MGGYYTVSFDVAVELNPTAAAMSHWQKIVMIQILQYDSCLTWWCYWLPHMAVQKLILVVELMIAGLLRYLSCQ